MKVEGIPNLEGINFIFFLCVSKNKFNFAIRYNPLKAKLVLIH